MRAKQKVKLKSTIYVAVVHKAWKLSGRPDGDWASFVNKNKKDAVAAAMKARSRWEAKGFGPYQIWVGELVEAVNVPVEYKLEAIVETKPAVMIPTGIPAYRGRPVIFSQFTGKPFDDDWGIN